MFFREWRLDLENHFQCQGLSRLAISTSCSLYFHYFQCLVFFTIVVYSYSVKSPICIFSFFRLDDVFHRSMLTSSSTNLQRIMGVTPMVLIYSSNFFLFHKRSILSYSVFLESQTWNFFLDCSFQNFSSISTF
jgi:hypothetical protein